MVKSRKLIEVDYFVYTRLEDSKQIISSNELPKFRNVEKRTSGKEAHLKAIFEFEGNELDKSLSSTQIKDYVNEHFFNTPKWSKYYSLYKKYLQETVLEKETYQFNYTCKVMLSNTVLTCAGKRVVVEPEEPKVIHMLSSQLIGNVLPNYNGLRNPIISIDLK